MILEEAQHCLKVLRFWNDYGLEATREAFGVSRFPFTAGSTGSGLQEGIP